MHLFLFFLVLVVPFIIFALFLSLSPSLHVTQIRGRQVGASLPLPTTVRAFIHIAGKFAKNFSPFFLRRLTANLYCSMSLQKAYGYCTCLASSPPPPPPRPCARSAFPLSKFMRLDLPTLGMPTTIATVPVVENSPLLAPFSRAQASSLFTLVPVRPQAYTAVFPLGGGGWREGAGGGVVVVGGGGGGEGGNLVY